MLYPPILASTQPVFDTTTLKKQGLIIDFTLASITSADDFDSIDLIICKQSNNAEVAKKSYEKREIVFNGKTGQIIEKNAASFKNFEAGYLYKVQLRLTIGSGETKQFSEWSTVLIIKYITTPSLQISAEDIILSSGTYVSSLTPTFKGVFNIDSTNKEIEEIYRFKLYQGNTIILESEWLDHKSNQEDIWYCNTKLQSHGYYSVFYEVKTINGYKASTSCSFQAIPPIQNELDLQFVANTNQLKARVDLSIIPGSEFEGLNGIYVISRSSERDNFNRFEDIKFLSYKNIVPQTGKLYYIFSDYTIESGVNYKYAIQQISSSSIRSKMKETDIVTINFDYAYLYRDGIQLKLSLNQNITSFKHTVLRSKQDTLGGKYPYLSQNGNAYYAEFALSGLISYQDNIDTFFNVHNDENVYYKDELVLYKEKFELNSGKREASTIPAEETTIFDHKAGYALGSATQENFYAYENDLIATPSRRGTSPIPTDNTSNVDDVELTRDYTISTDLLDNNIYIERKFREKVEEFLNDFSGKLYKSATEGNIIVTLMNVTYKPVDTVGRMLYEFTATAYEIAENTIENLDYYGIIDASSDSVGKEQSTIQEYFGQIAIDKFEVYITDRIKEQIELELNGNYQLKSLEKFWIEANIPKESLESNYYALYIDGVKTLVSTKHIYTPDFSLLAGEGEVSEGYNGIDLTLDSNHPPLLINYKGTIEQVANKEISFVTLESKYDFDQVIWNKSDGEDLVEFIQNAIATRSKWIEISEDQQGVKSWIDLDGNIWTFDHLRWIDITTQKGAVITIGISSEDNTDFTVGFVHNSENPRENTFNSNRIIFPTGRSEIDSHAKYLHIDTETANQAVINFSYYLLKETITQA